MRCQRNVMREANKCVWSLEARNGQETASPLVPLQLDTVLVTLGFYLAQ